MTWANRLRLYGGVLAVLLVSAVLVLVFNQRQASATSQSAEVSASEVNLGTDYGGVVSALKVKSGDTVTKGQTLLTVQSALLQQAAANGAKISSGETMKVDTKTGTMTFLAPATGTVSSLEAQQGGYVSSGGTVATIVAKGSQYVTADYTLAPVDYARVERGAHVDVVLPDNSIVSGKVADVKVSTVQGKAKLEVRVDSSALAGDQGSFNQPGTPVATTLELKDDGVLAGPSDALFQFLRKVGLK